MSDPEVACAYKKLKPICEEMMKSCDMQSVREVIKYSRNLSKNVVQQIHAYILFPFAAHIKNPQHRKNSKLRMAMADGFFIILSMVNVESDEIFFKYYTVLIYQFIDKRSEDSVAKLDEDFALKICNCLSVLLLRLKPEVRMKLYTRSSTPDIGQGIFFCVQIARTEKYKTLRIAAVECAMALSTVHDDIFQKLHYPKIDVDFANTVGEVLMFFLPGLLGGLLEVTTSDGGEILTCLAIRAIRRIITLVMFDKKDNKTKELTDKDFISLIQTHKPNSDKPLEDSDPFGKKLRGKGKEGFLKHLETATRNEAWYKAAGLKMTLIIKGLRPLKAHCSEKVRYELGNLCWDVVEYSMVHMTASMKFILEMLIGLSETEDTQLASLCIDAIKSFSLKTEHGSREIINLIEQNFYTYLSQIPRFLNSLDNHHQLGNMCLLRGYIRFLIMKNEKTNKLSKLEGMLSSPFIINRFTRTLIEIFRLETRDVKLLEEYTIRDINGPVSTCTPWKIFTYLNGFKCIRVAYDFCRLLGNHSVVDMIADYLFEKLKTTTEDKKEIYVILNEMICCSADNVYKKDHLYKSLINIYIEPENWYLPMNIGRTEKPLTKNDTLDVTVFNPRSWTKEFTPGLFEGQMETRYTDISYRIPDKDEEDNPNQNNLKECSTILQARDNVIQMCLMTEGIGMIAKTLGSRFQPFLLKTLYLILERAGSSNEFLHLAGLRSLHEITKAFGLRSIAELIMVNSDYFTHHVKMRLRKIADNSSVLDVLLVVMKFSESTILPCLYDIVSNVLHQCFGLNQQKNVLLYLRLFQTFVRYVKVKFTPENLEREKIMAVTAKINIIQQILDYKEKKIKSLNFESDIDKINKDELNKQYLEYNDSEDEDTPEDSSEPKAPPHIKMVAAIIQKSINFVPSKDRSHKLLAINVINEGFPIIKDNEDICLPLVHQVWDPLVNRLKESSQPLIMNRAFELLVTLGICSKDFIKARTIKDVFPIIYNFLKTSSKESYTKDTGSLYRQGQTYKLQLALLGDIGKLCLLLDLQERYIHKLMETVYVYLSCKQPKPLQEATVNLFKQLIDHNAAQTWLFLVKIWHGEKAIEPPKRIGSSIELTRFEHQVRASQKKTDYIKNVSTILEYYNKKYNLNVKTPTLAKVNENTLKAKVDKRKRRKQT